MKRPTRADVAKLSPRVRAKLREAALALSKKRRVKLTEFDVWEEFVADCWDDFVREESRRRSH